MSAEHEGAQFAIDRGFRVVPTPPGKRHPVLRGWPELATCDEAQIDEWWTEHPEQGVATALDQGVVCIDVDSPDALAGLETELGPLPPTLCDQRGERSHRFYRVPVDVRIPNRPVTQGVDVKSKGGAVALPPTRYPDGSRREWVDAEAEIAELPAAWLVRIAEPARPERPRHAPNAGELARQRCADRPRFVRWRCRR